MNPTPKYCAPGSGATSIHAALTLIGASVSVVEVAPWRGERERDKVSGVNPMHQVPVLVLPSGEVMSESASILIWLGDRYSEARLAPSLKDPRRAQYLRWMSFASSAIYALYWVRDEPSRLAHDRTAQVVIEERTAERIAACWRIMDSEMQPGSCYLLNNAIGVLHLYVTVISRWQPRRLRLYREAPWMADIVRRVDAEPRLAQSWAARYPFTTDWESHGP